MVPEHEGRYFGNTYCSLLDALPSSTRIVMVVEDKTLPFVELWLTELSVSRQICIIEMPKKYRITPWARDAQLSLSNPQGKPLLLKPNSYTRKDDGCVAELLQQNNICELISAPFYFEGGNILLTEDYLLVGADTIAQMEGENDAEKLSAFATALSAFDNTISNKTSRQIILIKSKTPVPLERTVASQVAGKPWDEVLYFRGIKGTQQPLFHIDMFLSLAGKTSQGSQRILVADPALAAHLLDEKTHPCAMAGHFDEIATDLEQQGFEVIRNPMPLIYMDKIAKAKRVWFHATTNNVLVQESTTKGNIVWLPQFGHDNWPELVKIDQYNQQLWEGFGYEVRLVAKCQYLAENVGGIHCMTNVLQRGEG